MTIEPALDPALQDLLVGIVKNFTLELQSIVYPAVFDMKQQVSRAIDEERRKMDQWRDQHLARQEHLAHGLPTYLPNRSSNLASTPPMSLPYLDHLHGHNGLDATLASSYSCDTEASSSSFHGLPSWTSGSSNSSPFRQHGFLPSSGGTVSPRELLANHDNNNDLLYEEAASYHDDTMSMLTFSDSDNSMSAMPAPPPAPASHRRRSGKTPSASLRSAQSLTYQESPGRRPLPNSPGQAIAPRAFGGPLGADLGADGGAGHQGVFFSPHHDQTLTPKAPKSSARSHHRAKPSTPRAPAFSPVPSTTSMSPQPALFTTPFSPIPKSSGFPPGQLLSGFVPIGRTGIASRAQGNTWPVDRDLFEQLVAAERGHLHVHQHHRGHKLTYKEILAKYSAWDVKESTLRGIKRKITLPKEHRERKPRWGDEHVASLRLHVPLNTDHKGKVSWAKVVAAIKRDTGRPFGAGTTSKKWADLNNHVKNTSNTVAAAAQSQSGGEEGDVDEGGSSPEVVSEEDLPSLKFPFQREDGVW